MLRDSNGDGAGRLPVLTFLSWPPRYSLFTLLVVLTVLCVVGAWTHWYINIPMRESRAATKLREAIPNVDIRNGRPKMGRPFDISATHGSLDTYGYCWQWADSLPICSIRIADSDLRRVPWFRFSEFSSLQIANVEMRSRLSESQITDLVGIHTLHALVLDDNEITSEQTARLKANVSLRQLRFGNAGINDEELESLLQIPNLEVLCVPNNPCSARSLARPAACSSTLVHLDLKGCPCGDEGLLGIEQFQRLAHLDISREGGVGRAIRVANSASDEMVADCQVTEKGFAAISRCRSLVSLDCSGVFLSDAALDFIARIPGLKSVSLQDTGCGKTTIRTFCRRRPDVAVRWMSRVHRGDVK